MPMAASEIELLIKAGIPDAEVTIRDLVLGAELAASSKDRADYLELRGNAQFTVPEDRLVESVQEVLVRHI